MIIFTGKLPKSGPDNVTWAPKLGSPVATAATRDSHVWPRGAQDQYLTHRGDGGTSLTNILEVRFF